MTSNAWQMAGPDGDLRIHRQYKARIRRRTTPRDDSWSTDNLLKRLARSPSKRKRPDPATATGEAFIVTPADFQIGGRGGVTAFLDRFDAARDKLHTAAEEHRREGVQELVIAYMGDMGEGAFGQYDSQLWEVDLDRDDQTRLTAGVELTLARDLAPMFTTTTLVAVPGNHTRNTTDGYPTGEHDVADMTAFKWAASLLTYSGEADKWGIRFVAPDKHCIDGALFARVDAGGTRILFAHGHKSRGSAEKLKGWWKDVSFSRWGDADATDHLVTGHRHHVRVEECSKDRWLIVCPTLGGPSTYFHDSGGPTSTPGILHYVTRDAAIRALNIAA
ncbi:MAG: hypothetical protein ACOYOQ_00590 [Microthrixaceae bacterium]